MALGFRPSVLPFLGCVIVYSTVVATLFFFFVEKNSRGTTLSYRVQTQDRRLETATTKTTTTTAAAATAAAATTTDLSQLHLIHTRFMQDQGNLLMLARARLLLFETFCLPTMVHQTNQNFFWIIATDPDLLPEIREEMVELLQPYPNFYLVATNDLLFNNKKRDKILRGSEIFTGDVETLERTASHYMMRRDQIDQVTLVETRLDADDGLRLDFVERIQDSVHNLTSSASWYYWCAADGTALEWRPSLTASQGTLHLPQHSITRRTCLTAALTMMRRGNATKVPAGNHRKLYNKILEKGGCGSLECIKFYKERYVIRSRTWTSVGMAGVLMGKIGNVAQDHLGDFHIEADMLRKSNHFLFENAELIAQDNLAGQCTKHHSCKESAKKQLKMIIDHE